LKQYVKEPLIELKNRRPLSGTQLIDRKAFKEFTSIVDDDFLFRNEDLVFSNLCQQAGFEYKITEKTYHVHQIGHNRKNENRSTSMNLRIVHVPTKEDHEIYQNQLCGLIKYTSISDKHVRDNFDISWTIYNRIGGNKEVILELIKNHYGWKVYLRKYKIRMIARRLRYAFRIVFKFSDYDVLNL